MGNGMGCAEWSFWYCPFLDMQHHSFMPYNVPDFSTNNSANSIKHDFQFWAFWATKLSHSGRNIADGILNSLRHANAETDTPV